MYPSGVTMSDKTVAQSALLNSRGIVEGGIGAVGDTAVWQAVTRAAISPANKKMHGRNFITGQKIASIQPQRIRHGISSRLLLAQPFGRSQRTQCKRIPIRRHVPELHALAQRSEINRML